VREFCVELLCMTDEQGVVGKKRRTPAEIGQIVSQYQSSPAAVRAGIGKHTQLLQPAGGEWGKREGRTGVDATRQLPMHA
jgi:hypothetical protein